MNGYIAMYKGKQKEIYARNLGDAAEAAVEYLKVSKKDRGLLSVHLVEKADGSEVTVSMF